MSLCHSKSKLSETLYKNDKIENEDLRQRTSQETNDKADLSKEALALPLNCSFRPLTEIKENDQM